MSKPLTVAELSDHLQKHDDRTKIRIRDGFGQMLDVFDCYYDSASDSYVLETLAEVEQ